MRAVELLLLLHAAGASAFVGSPLITGRTVAGLAISYCGRPRIFTGARQGGGRGGGVLSQAQKKGASGLKCSVQGEWEQFVLDIQKEIIAEAEAADGKGKFIEDRWERPGNSGYGITRVMEGGNIWEKAACSVSVVRGKLSKERAQSMSSRGRRAGEGDDYFAAACSLVFHSASPKVPTFRADVRYFAVEGGDGWYGGGADLTPYYLYDEDAAAFHRYYKDVCERYDAGSFAKYKKWCDDYFYIPARQEHRGVGGIFFDDLATLSGGGDPVDFVKDVARGFMPSYLHIANKRKQECFTDDQREWQLVRRGRYLEFNLLYDRGVRFGLDGQGRTESVMVSAPPLIAWKYRAEPKEGSEEHRLVKVLASPKEWV